MDSCKCCKKEEDGMGGGGGLIEKYGCVSSFTFTQQRKIFLIGQSYLLG